jgi:hypothetical protein
VQMAREYLSLADIIKKGMEKTSWLGPSIFVFTVLCCYCEKIKNHDVGRLMLCLRETVKKKDELNWIFFSSRSNYWVLCWLWWTWRFRKNTKSRDQLTISSLKPNLNWKGILELLEATEV